MSIQILHGDCRETLKGLAAGSVHTCVTSPPYWGLRDYGVAGQLGLEATPEEYVQKMVEVFREVKRVLRDDGTLWLNLGDSYASGGRGPGGDPETRGEGRMGRGTLASQAMPARKPPAGLKPKDLVGIPWMVAFALRADGWYLRADIIWHKPNPMPESVTDRPTKAHEYIFLLAKSPAYYYDHEAIKEPAARPGDVQTFGGAKGRAYDPKPDDPNFRNGTHQYGRTIETAATANKRSVWSVTTKPFSGAHFATFPPDLIEPCIKAGSSEKGCCPTCGAPWERVLIDTGERREVEDYKGQSKKDYQGEGVQDPSDTKRRILESQSKVKVSEWRPTCTCPLLPPNLCTVLDPFGGAGTTGLVSDRLGRHAILCELNPEYIAIAEKRLTADSPLFADVETAG